jgi:hypothetical protein
MFNTIQWKFSRAIEVLFTEYLRRTVQSTDDEQSKVLT